MDARMSVMDGGHSRALKYARSIKFVVLLLFDVVVTIFVVKLFDIPEPWIWLVVYLGIVLLGYMKSLLRQIGNMISYKIVLKGILEAEIKEDIKKYHKYVYYDYHNISNYDDFLQSVASSEDLPTAERLKAAISYGMVKQKMMIDRVYEKRVSAIFSPLLQSALHPYEETEKGRA